MIFLFWCEIRRISHQMNKEKLQHKLNVLHIYCRLKDKKFPNKFINIFCIIYEFIYKITKLLYKEEKNEQKISNGFKNFFRWTRKKK